MIDMRWLVSVPQDFIPQRHPAPLRASLALQQFTGDRLLKWLWCMLQELVTVNASWRRSWMCHLIMEQNAEVIKAIQHGVERQQVRFRYVESLAGRGLARQHRSARVSSTVCLPHARLAF